ncbi:WYL domain-containing protein [Fusibacillus kribbianus]|uniref:WYL domain-containing protein n=1 Tax=Fusibacillus kribbianus TaxID=3044208 RepID=A0AAP4BDK1_9FIRM|nr:WYL domain-containing protein [Ruminococcus sp. YH-rum2234]MDI9243198.1 WYL domain-containing protein [Ruminococcus sp. YH-rum2234]
MRILMLGNSFTFVNNMPDKLAQLTGAEVIHHTRGGARLAEQLNPETKMGSLTQAALQNEKWDYVILQEMSNGPVTSKDSFLKNVGLLCEKIRANGAMPVLYATWAYQKGGKQLASFGMDYDEMYQKMHDAYHEVAAQNRALIADVGKRFYELADRQNIYAEDGCHPNESGSQIAAQVIADVILADQAKHTEVVVETTADDNDTRLRILYLYQMLLTQSDEEHPLSTKQITDRMMEQHNIHMHRTTVPKDIELLRAAGFDIIGVRRRAWEYHLADRQFSLPELKLLIDAVQSSKFITEKKSKILIEKLISLTSENNADKLQRTVHITGRAKTDNEKGYYIVDAINDAMNAGVKISFLYFDYDGKKKQILRNDGNPYTVSPYDLIWDGDFYYLTGYCDEREEVRVFRVDRIKKQPELLKDIMVKPPKGYSVTKYTQEVFRMFDTQEISEVVLLCENSAMKSIIDRFGITIRTKSLDDEHFQVKVKVCAGPTFYRWVFGFDGKIKIVGPDEIKKQYRERLLRALEEI